MSAKLTAVILLCLFFTSQAMAQVDEPDDKKLPAKGLSTEASTYNQTKNSRKHRSIGFQGVLATYGQGISFCYRKAIGPYTSVVGETDILNVPQNNPVLAHMQMYYGPENSELVLVTIFWGIRREIWTDIFPQNFSPFLGVGIGPVFAFEDLYFKGFRFRNRFPYMSAYLHAQTHLTGGGYLGAGFVTSLSKKWTTEFEVRYNVIYFNQEVGGERNYSGFYLSLGIARIF